MTQLKTMPKFTPAKSTDSAANFDHLPKKIFQTWETDQVPQGMYDAMHSWIDLNPDWEHHFFTDDDRRAFIQQHFDQDVIDAYDNLIPGAYRADLWRYCILYIHGGIYADCKLVLHQPLNILLPQNCEFMMAKDVVNTRRMAFSGYLYNAFIVSTPQHPFLEKAIKLVVSNVRRGFYGWDPLSVTGPGLFGRVVNLCTGKAETASIETGNFQHKALSYTILPELKRPISMNIPPYLSCITSYSNYYLNDRAGTAGTPKNLNQDYAACWFLEKVYHNDLCQHDSTSNFHAKRLPRFLAGHVKKAYQTGNKTMARAHLLEALKKNWFNWHLWLTALKSEARHLFHSFTR